MTTPHTSFLTFTPDPAPVVPPFPGIEALEDPDTRVYWWLSHAAAVGAWTAYGMREDLARHRVREDLEDAHPDVGFSLCGAPFPLLDLEDLRPHPQSNGYPAVDCKVRDARPSVADCADIISELGEDPARVALVPGKPDEDPLPFGLEWLEAFEDAHPETVGNCWEDLARMEAESLLEGMQENYPELRHRNTRIYQCGQSGGWAYLDGGPNLSDLEDAQWRADEDEDEDATAEERAEAAEELRDGLRLLSHFAERIRLAVDGFPRWLAEDLYYILFLPAAEALESERGEARCAADYDATARECIALLADLAEGGCDLWPEAHKALERARACGLLQDEDKDECEEDTEGGAS